MRKLIAVLILCTVPGYCAQTATLQWLVRQDGADTNGGGFDVGVSSPGTNESTGAVGTSVTITVGVTTTQAVSVPAFTSTTHGPGNVLVLSGTTSGSCNTSATTRYTEVSQSAGTATFDTSLGTAGSVCTGTLGGGFATIAKAWAVVAAPHQTEWLCGTCGTGTFTLTTVLNTPSSTYDDVTLWGYSATPNDITPVCIALATCTRPTIQSATASINMIDIANGVYLVLNGVNILAQSGFNQYAILVGNSDELALINTKMTGTGLSPTIAVNAYNTSQPLVYLDNTEITNWYWGIFVSSTSGTMQTVIVKNSYIHGNTFGLTDDLSGTGEQGGNPFTWVSDNSVWDSNGYGMYMLSDSVTPVATIIARGSDFTNSTHDGINSQSGYHAANTIGVFTDDIFYGNGGFGIDITQNGSCPSGVPGASGSGNAGMVLYNNGVGSNTSGNYSTCLTSINDVALSASPFVSSSNFALNSTSGGGAALLTAGFPGVTGFGTGYSDIGPLQHQAAAAAYSAVAYVQ